MAINTQTIRIDLNTGRTIPVAFAHQNDTNRQLTFQLYNNGVAFTPSSTTVKFAYKSPIVNGRYSVITGSQMASGTVSGNTVTVTLPAQYTQVSGVGLLTMILTTSGNTLRPVNIKFVCQGSADGDDTILAASDWPEGLYDYMDNWLEENEPTEIANLKSELSFVNSELLSINGSYYLDLEKKQRYVNNGAEVIANNAKWLSLRQGKYISFKAGDVVLTTEPSVYHFRVMTSTDNGSTWSMTGESDNFETISNDCIGWVSVIKTTDATLSDVDYINKNHVIVFQSSNYNALDQIDCKLNAISNVEIVGYNSGIGFIFVHPTDTAVSLIGGKILTVNSVSKDDKITFKFDAEALENPENFTRYEFAIREVNSSESIIKNEFVQFPESNSIEYTVYYSAAVKLIVTLTLYRSSTTVSANYHEPVRYSVSATKGGDSLSELLTESGETWEV